MKKTLPQNKTEWLLFAKNTGLILFGTFVLAFGISMFIFPFDLVTGGVSGIGIIISKAVSNISFLNTLGADTYSSIINWILFALGFLILGKSFAMNSATKIVHGVGRIIYVLNHIPDLFRKKKNKR